MALKNKDRVSATRARLINAAIEALAEIGYHRTTFVEVSRRSELSRGAIHHHFESIPDLMAAVTRDISRQLEERLRADLAALPTGIDLFDQGLDLLWTQMRQPPFQAFQQIRNALATDPALEPVVRDEVKALWDWLQKQTSTLLQDGLKQSTPPESAVIRLVLAALADSYNGNGNGAVADVPPGSTSTIQPPTALNSEDLTTLKTMVRRFTGPTKSQQTRQAEATT